MFSAHFLPPFFLLLNTVIIALFFLYGKVFDKKNTITTGADVLIIPENLRRFGISTVNHQNLINSGKATQEVIERSLGALSFDVENGKTGNSGCTGHVK